MGTQVRRELENWLHYLHGLLGRYESLWGQRSGLEQQLQPEQRHRTKWKMWLVAPFALGFMFLAFTVFSRVTGLITNLVLLPFSGVEYGDPLEGLVRFLMWTVPIVLCVALAIAVVLLRNRVLLPKANAKITASNQQRAAHNEMVFAQIRDLDTQISVLDQELNKNVGNSFPEYYLNQEAVSFCWHMVNRGRAETIKEALNLYEDKLKEDREALRDQQQAAELRQLRKQVGVGNVINAAGHTANYLETRNNSRNRPPGQR